MGFHTVTPITTAANLHAHLWWLRSLVRGWHLKSLPAVVENSEITHLVEFAIVRLENSTIIDLGNSSRCYSGDLGLPQPSGAGLRAGTVFWVPVALQEQLERT